MNRIKISPLATAQLDEFESPPPTATATPDWRGSPTQNEFSLFVPMHYEKNYAYPLIVWLHSESSDCTQLQTLMPSVSMRNYVAIGPQSVSNPLWSQTPAGVETAYESVMGSIDQASARFNIATHRIYLAGAGAGGTMAFRLAFERPDLFAGVISINGQLPTDNMPLRDWSRCRKVPVLLSNFRDSKSFSQTELCQQLRLLHVAGFRTTVRQYPGHSGLNPKVLSDVNNWVMESIDSAIPNRRAK
jgi:phospholipase/carboxylesterase